MSYLIVKLTDYKEPKKVATMMARDNAGINGGDIELYGQRGELICTVSPSGIESIGLGGFVRVPPPPTVPAENATPVSRGQP